MVDTPAYLYALALGSNRPLSARRTPARLVDEAAALMGRIGPVLARSPTIETAPIGPSLRRYANAALLIESPLAPHAMLAALQAIERDLGRRRFRRWGARSIDIDIILWSGGAWNSRALTIPHPAFRVRAFVLTPLLNIVPDWRDPRSGLTVRHLAARLAKAASRG
ncbi:2-amino-4-hydroxy-6-hydroxymethyldihydropteridine diphosphokinase [Sphingobium sp.]|uniref:2-amino-4-hydroxy-6- hydroxymethyldihydropteridine diphosphokinase n=1 Tax=Sphingobium sp. TaxID=1912891 RepID=UPI003BB4A8B5